MKDSKSFDQWKYWAQCAISVLDEYSTYFNLSQQQFSSKSNHLLIMSNPKGFFLFGALDEVSKIGTAMFRWIDFVSGEKISDSSSFPTRSIIQAVFEEQQLWGRKLLEALVDLILFGETNNEQYYKHYLLINELKTMMNQNDDWTEFFGKPSNNLEFQKKIWVKSIADCEPFIELSKCWYLKDKKSISKTPKVNKNVETLRQKLIRAMSQTTAREKLIFGLSYRNYTHLSESIHFDTNRDKSFPNENDIIQNMGKIWITILCVINRVQNLIGAIPDGFKDEFNSLLSLPTNEENLILQITGDFYQIKDIVLLDNKELCMIQDVIVSKYGYKLFKVSYLEHTIRPEPYEEWIAGNMMSLILKYSDHKKAQANDPSIYEYLKSVAEEEYLQHYSAFIVRIWNNGMKEYFLTGKEKELLKAFKL
ncbi:hypothetical protein [Paenibacillus sp. P36]|uniref:hypothetical protein n=1 Tax=Paenibacillus sp. P36 TaxID=3342538 RepID=UPI0038B2A62A